MDKSEYINKQPLEALEYNWFTQYVRLDQIMSDLVKSGTFKTSSTGCYLFIDIQQYIDTLLIYQNLPYLAIFKDVLNLAAHYRYYFNKPNSPLRYDNVTVFLVNGARPNNGIINETNYKIYENNIFLIKSVAKYVKGLYYVDSNVIPTEVLTGRLIMNSGLNDVFIVSKNHMLLQNVATFQHYHAMIRPKKTYKGDQSEVITMENVLAKWVSYEKNYRNYTLLQQKLESFNPAILGLIISYLGCKSLGYTKLDSINNVVKKLSLYIARKLIPTGAIKYLSPELFDKEIISRFYNTDLMCRINNYASVAVDNSGLIDIEDMNKLVEMNDKFLAPKGAALNLQALLR